MNTTTYSYIACDVCETLLGYRVINNKPKVFPSTYVFRAPSGSTLTRLGMLRSDCVGCSIVSAAYSQVNLYKIVYGPYKPTLDDYYSDIYVSRTMHDDIIEFINRMFRDNIWDVKF